MVQLPFNSNTRLVIYLVLSILVLCLSGCRSKKSAIEKTKEKTVEITTNDIKTANKLTIETSVIKLTASENFSVEPVNNDKPVQVIRGRDTLNFSNAKVNFNTTTTKEDTNTRSNQSQSASDNSTTKKESESAAVTKDQTVKSSSWGANLALIFGVIFLIIAVACGVYLHFNTPKNPLS